ncbi:MAG: hypothetical protein IT370_32140 [Deltaproteobacteria bacterium]|nr:hypothetical protein [Deltaproteobacteria bacterium]
MAERRKLVYCFDSQDMGRTAEAIVEQGLTPVGRPEEIEIDLKEKTVDDDWVTTLATGSGKGKKASATWNGMMDTLSLERACVRGINNQYELDPPSLVRRLGRIPFTVASFGSVHPWAYRPPSFGELHYALGWGCAFQGAGHGRLVSRRWLGTGPWRVLRGPSDTTLVELHDLSLGMAEALAQAQASHAELMAGFITFAHKFQNAIEGLHKGADRALVITVHGRVVSAGELLDAAAARLLQPLGADRPIDKVVYVFVDRAAAEAQLPTMWRYGHHVHLIGDDGVERRIDDTYMPRLQRPEWTRGDAGKELLA